MKYLFDTPQIVGGIIAAVFILISAIAFYFYYRAAARALAEAEARREAELKRLKKNMVNARGLALVRDSLTRMGDSLRGFGGTVERAKDAFADLKAAIDVIPAEVMPDEFIQPDEGFKYFCTDDDRIVYRQIRFAYIPTPEEDEH